jgi:uncharacterized cupredoxin-like copper-binding protein
MALSSRALVAAFALVLAVSVASCSSDSGGGDAGDVTATEQDYTISLDKTEVPAGSTTFSISNEAGQTHEFVVVKTDLDAGELPTGEDGDVDEEGEGIEPVDEVEDIAAGSTESLTVDLAAGSYVVICNLPGHYRQGMRASFTVT